MKKSLLIFYCLILGLLPIEAQSVTIIEKFQLHPMASALVMYKNQFGKWEKPDLDDTFPYAVIRMKLIGNESEVTTAKKKLTLYMGVMTAVQDVYKDNSNELLFLVPARRPTIYIDCGDGCEKVLLMENQQLRSNGVYYGTVHYENESILTDSIIQSLTHQIEILEDKYQDIIDNSNTEITDTAIKHNTIKYEVISLPYMTNRFSIGARGGAAYLLPQSESSLGAVWGFDALLDLQYAHYWCKGEGKIRLGLLTGLSAGYMQNQKTIYGLTEFSEYGVGTDSHFYYTVTIDEISTMNSQLQLEIPVMFSMITNGGFFLNAGSKFILPVYTPYSQTLTNTSIIAVDVETGIKMLDHLFTGVLDKNYSHRGMNNHQWALTIALGVELGHEYMLKSGHSVSIGVYANYGLYSTYKHQPTSTDAVAAHNIVNIVPPHAGSIAEVSVNSVINARADRLGYFDIGMKIAFHLNWKKVK